MTARVRGLEHGKVAEVFRTCSRKDLLGISGSKRFSVEF
jgi:hypothetical protein